MQVRVTCSSSATSTTEAPSSTEAAAVGAVCAFLYATFTVLPSNLVMTGLAYRAELVPQLWQYIKRCHLAHSWPSLELVGDASDSQVPADLLGWMLPLAVFCPVFRWDSYLPYLLEWELCNGPVQIASPNSEFVWLNYNLRRPSHCFVDSFYISLSDEKRNIDLCLCFL